MKASRNLPDCRIGPQFPRVVESALDSLPYLT